jgi:2-oxoglutarate ferredoxin oxidoreductase subunit gamma
MFELRVTGFGGQGVIRAGQIIGKALSLHGGKFATLTQAFGPEARGSSCSAQVVIDDVPVTYPYIRGTDGLVAMSQEGYSKYRHELRPGGVLIYERDLVVIDEPPDRRRFSIPATRVAEQIGMKMSTNIVMVGFVGAVTGLLSIEILKQTLPSMVPERFLEQNKRALSKGWEFGLAEVAAAGAAVKEAVK